MSAKHLWHIRIMPLRGCIVNGVKSIQKKPSHDFKLCRFQGSGAIPFFFVANTNYLFAIFVRHEMSVRLCGSMYTHSFVCVLVSVSECTRNVLLCGNEFFCGWSHAFSYTERKKQKKNVHMNFCASTQRRTLLFMLFFSTIYVEGVSFLLTNIYILVRMLWDCMRVQREQGESCFIWLCGQVSALASAPRARSLLLISFSLCTLCQRHQAAALLYISFFF